MELVVNYIIFPWALVLAIIGIIKSIKELYDTTKQERKERNYRPIRKKG